MACRRSLAGDRLQLLGSHTHRGNKDACENNICEVSGVECGLEISIKNRDLVPMITTVAGMI